MAGNRARLTLAVASVAFVNVAVVLMFSGGWTVACPKTGSTGLMDCGGQPDAVWRSDLPSWVTLRRLFAATLIGGAGFVFAVMLELWTRRPRRYNEKSPAD